MKENSTIAKKIQNNYIDAESIEKNFIYYEDLEANPELLRKILEESEQEIREGKGTPIEEFMAEMEAKYHFNEI